MITLALDMSTKSSGWAIFDNQSLKSYGCITSDNENVYKRIDKMINELNKILSQYKVDSIAIEDVIPEDVRNNQNVFKKLTYLQGFVLHLLNKRNITNIKFFVASEWRKKCGIKTGRGIERNTLKQKDIQFVKDQYGLDVNDDVADAICIGYAHTNKAIKPKPSVRESAF